MKKRTSNLEVGITKYCIVKEGYQIIKEIEEKLKIDRTKYESAM